MDGNVQQYGFPSLETLLKSYPDTFRLEGKKWYGKVTKENEDLVRSMATEKPRKRDSFSASNRGPNRVNSDFEKKCRIQENRQPLEAESKCGDYKKSDEVESGKKSSSYASKKPPSTNRVAAFSHFDRSPYFMAPSGFENQRPFHPKRDRYTFERRIKPKCCRNMASGRNVAPLCSPGLNINVDQNQLSRRFSPTSNENHMHSEENDTSDWSKEMRSVLNSIAPSGFKNQHASFTARGGYTLKRKMKHKFFCNVSSGGNVARLYPSGRNVNDNQNQPRHCSVPTSNENLMHNEENDTSDYPKEIRSGEPCTDTSEWDRFDHTRPPDKAVRNALREYLNGRNCEESEELKTAKEGCPRPEGTFCVIVVGDAFLAQEIAKVFEEVISELTVHFVDLLAILLCRNGFVRIQKVVMNQPGCRSPSSRRNPFGGISD
ncbi:unnamed protein product [Angiostrongylus costaricensis]|uniref:HTH OST-type domain-containing protein n=1 Tax=Angiostrongylus costaricensis TaxID=334426 RepID=A0A158PMF0_ANGCS|nr:unnamed protein product [Angiostrongylus costaricensis]